MDTFLDLWWTTAGACFATIVMVARPALPPAAAWITAVPVPLEGAVYRPFRVIEPRPLTLDQVKLG
jgi:hypothetical protein